ncbi:MAG: DNA helicase RecQ [Clostridia bacterium]
MSTAKELLKEYFGYDEFRLGQADIIDNILNKKDAVGIMPTGAGKSICYQIPALKFSGTTIVISPLISLMKDQVDTLKDMGIQVAYINSSLSIKEYNYIKYMAKDGAYKLIYVAPERFCQESFINLLNSIKVPMIAIDEAHCVSQWGHDFRPTYKKIPEVINKLKQRPVVTAFTATATALVKEDIIKSLQLKTPFIKTTGFDRANLNFIVQKPQKKLLYITKYLDKHKNSSGVIYCSTRKTVDSLYEKLKQKGYSVCRYHAGLSDKEKKESQENFIYDNIEIIIATNAFGMGIDKSNISFVIHYNMPSNMESYYQEAGRAGRDGKAAECVLLFSRADVITNKFLIEQSHLGDISKEIKKLNKMIDYSNTDRCLRKYILEYFGEQPNYDKCDNCGNCNSKYDLVNITEESKKIISCIIRMKNRFGTAMVADVLKGSNTARLRTLELDLLSTYGIMKKYTKDSIKEMISYLISEGYIDSVGDKYPILVVTKLGNDILFYEKEVYIKGKRIESEVEKSPMNEELLQILKKLRKKVAIENNVPPFVIFSDISLAGMCEKYPVNEEELLKISGIGTFKQEKYGKLFINAIIEYIKKNKMDFKDTILAEKTSKESVESNSKQPEVAKNIFEGNTYDVTYELAKSGSNMEQIASIRGVSLQTVQNHFLKLYLDGKKIEIEKYINTQSANIIIEAISKLGEEKLKPIKDALPENINYFDIKYYIAKKKKERTL